VALEPADADLRIRVSAVGPGAGLHEETQRLLDGDSSGIELQPRSIQPFFTSRLAADMGSAVSVDVSEVGRVEIAAIL
jgi:hypothetical protein